MAAEIEAAGAIQGQPVWRVTLDNDQGLRASLLSFGATLQSLRLDDGRGPGIELALGFDTPAEYAGKSGHLGATAGRFANRIRDGRFKLDGRTYALDRNENGRQHLHGGSGAFGKRLWQVETDAARNRAHFTMRSQAGEAGYPGTVDASCTYELRGGHVLAIEMSAVTDAPTPINLVNHAYWNLAGTPTIFDHTLRVDADEVLEVDAETVPTGRRLQVAGTKLDFRTPRPIGPDGQPYLDNCFVLRPAMGLRFVAELCAPTSGRSLTLWSDQPGVQVYSGFKLDTVGRGGAPYRSGAGICLETQGFPDAPNHPDFPSAILRPGDVYIHRMEHRFN